MRQHGLHTGGARLETFEPKQRVEPDQPVTGFVQALHLPGEVLARIAIESVADQHDHGVLSENAARPALVEFLQRRSDARAAGPVGGGLRYRAQRNIDIAMPQMPGHVGKPGTEDKAVHAVAVVGDGMQEVQEHARVAAHGARDVAEHDQGRVAAAVRAAAQRNDVGVAAQAGAQARTQVDLPAVRIGMQAPGSYLRNRQAQARDQAFGLLQFLRGHGLEVLALQAFDFGRAERGVRFDVLLLRPHRHFLRQAQRLGDAIRGLVLLILRRRCLSGLQQCAVEQMALAPEQPERVVEEFEVLVAGQKDGRQRPVEILALLDAGEFQGAQPVQHPVRPDRHARFPQRAGEVNNVFSQIHVVSTSTQRRKGAQRTQRKGIHRLLTMRRMELRSTVALKFINRPSFLPDMRR